MKAQTFSSSSQRCYAPALKLSPTSELCPYREKKASRNGDYLNVWRAPALSICILQTSEIHAMAVRQQRLATLRNFITFT